MEILALHLDARFPKNITSDLKVFVLEWGVWKGEVRGKHEPIVASLLLLIDI